MASSTLLEDIRGYHFDDWGKLLTSEQVRLLADRFLHKDPPPAAVAGFRSLRDLIEYAKRVEPQRHTLDQLVKALERCDHHHVVIEINKSFPSPTAPVTPASGIGSFLPVESPLGVPRLRWLEWQARHQPEPEHLRTAVAALLNQRVAAADVNTVDKAAELIQQLRPGTSPSEFADVLHLIPLCAALSRDIRDWRS